MKAGQLCVKIAGRDAGRECVIVEVLDDNFVLIDGNTRRRKCNVDHLEPIGELKIKSKASHDEVIEAMKKQGIKIIKKGASRKKAEKKSEVKKKDERRSAK